MPTIVTEAKEIPRYAQMARDIEAKIGCGALPPGSRLPSFGHMRTEYGASPATMERVYATLEKKGLIRREAKRGIFVAQPEIRTAPQVIGLVWNQDERRDSYYAQILRGVQEGARRQGLQVLLIPEAEAAHAESVGGLIISGYQGDHSKSDYKAEYLKLLPKLPTVCILCHDATLPEVVSNDRQGILEAMGHLFENGHRRIGYLTAGCQINADDLSRERLAAYFEALDAAGIEQNADYIHALYDSGVFLGFREQGRYQMTEWLRDGWVNLGCTALLAQNDDTAIGAIEALHTAGYRVPQDISVVGFDGTAGTDYFSPRLTTLKVPLQAIGSHCVDLLVKVVGQPVGANQEVRKQRIVLPNTLRVGESTCPVAGHDQNAYFEPLKLEEDPTAATLVAA